MRGLGPQIGTPLIDRITEPRYSAAEIAAGAAVGTVEFFNYRRGAVISGGTVVSDFRETNQEQPNLFPQPKSMRVNQVRLVFSPVDEDGSTELDGSAETAGLNCDALDAIKAILFGTHVEFSIGDKSYLNHPAWFFPANVGLKLGGDADYMTQDAEEHRILSSITTVGEPYRMEGLEWFIPPLQNFRFVLRARAALNGMIDDNLLVWAFLDGEFSRETL